MVQGWGGTSTKVPSVLRGGQLVWGANVRSIQRADGRLVPNAASGGVAFGTNTP
jgi:hypothetical protein